ncbi:MAG TPA: formate--tetrahydrofolate ligase [Dehalococcoidia bacterium]|nr:formate--tetrahydrofolate ligase [Dehalococcoidia bacterium]|tara:strand:- start:722 stop:2356 length:1635 start_codon:yes stop_codon:yes gene_type:complete
MRPIAELASEMGLDPTALEPYGQDKAKVPLNAFPNADQKAKLIVITAITPTPAGEGKSTTAVGLTQGLAKIGKKPVLTIRQPALGPVFGHKGGGTGGGKSTVQPAVDINLHFTGDFHAIESAHNLLAAMVDNAVYRNAIDDFDASGVIWRRVTDAEDRALRTIMTGAGGRLNGPVREAGFDINAASEMMAICALASSYEDLRERISDIVVGWKKDRKTPVTAREIGGVGSIMALMRDALKPNLVQTAEGQPTIVHMGPFGNIAHGCSSIIADQLAENCGEYVVTEAGFGADLGFEKFMDIKVRQGGPEPSAAVVITTIRGLKWHGDVALKDMETTDPEAVRRGAENLKNALRIVGMYGLPAVVAINRFPTDAAEEIAVVKEVAIQAGAVGVEEAKGFAEGGNGMTDLAQAVVHAADQPSDVKLLYDDDDDYFDKVENMAKSLYKASSVEWGPMTRTTARRFAANGWNFPVCIAKTHLSISSDPKLKGAPSGHTLPIRELRILAGARQIVTLAGDIITLPGLPSKPNAWDIDLNDDGEITGILST